ncbi:MAG: hypothetical protein K2F63_01700, partial [Muribaculaceae bacterium]|nr:hypothetical protein [Muribaculaceae bacterium]
IQAHPTTAGIYRLVNPYDPEKFPYSLSFFGAYDSDNDYYIIINAENPDLVYLDRAETGIILDGTPTSSWSAYGNLLSQGKTPDPSTAGTLKNGVITMPERSLLNLMDVGDGYGAYYGNIEGTFRVVLPGYEKPTEWENIGMADFTDGFYGKFLLGADFTPTPYKVLVQKSLVEEGQYRIVDPYGASGYDAPESSDNYFYIDASNPDCVLWQYTTGSSYLNQTVILGTEGDFMIASNKATAEEVADAEMGGKFADEIFTVSADHTGYYVLGRLPVFRPNNIEAVLDLKNMEPWEPAEEETPASLKSLRVF